MVILKCVNNANTMSIMMLMMGALTKSGGVRSAGPRTETCGEVARVVRTTLAELQRQSFAFHDDVVDTHLFPSEMIPLQNLR